MAKIILFQVIVIGLVGLSWCQSIKVKLSGRNLKPGDAIWGPPDPFVKVGYAIGSNAFTNVGKTSTLHTENPVWTETFDFQFVQALNQRVQFEVIENDAFVDDKYGTVTIPLSDVLNAPGRVLEKDFGKGILIIQNIA